MNLFDFTKRFPDEEECIHYLISIRENTGLVCSKCGSKKHRWIGFGYQFECAKCGNRKEMKSGTVLESTKLPVKYWFMAMFLLTSSDEEFTTQELYHKLDFKESEQIADMFSKLIDLKKQIGPNCHFDKLLYTCLKDRTVSVKTTTPVQC